MCKGNFYFEKNLNTCNDEWRVYCFHAISTFKSRDTGLKFRFDKMFFSGKSDTLHEVCAVPIFNTGTVQYIYRHVYIGRILGRIPDKISKSFPPCYSQSHLQICLTISISSIRLGPETSMKLYVHEFGFSTCTWMGGTISILTLRHMWLAWAFYTQPAGE